MAKLDENRIYTLLGEDTNGNAVPVKVSSSGELVVEYVITGATSSANEVPKNDSNYVPVSKAESSNSAVSFLTDSNGYVIVSGITIS